MPQQFWKTLDEYHGQAPVSDDEFDAEVQRALQALRTEHGIDEQGRIATDGDGQRSHRPIAPGADPAAHARQLRALLPATNRRGFLQLTGAAAVFGLAGCWYEAPETLVPHVVQPPGSTVGNARYYSTTIRTDGRPVGVMAKSYDGRPIKLEGNPDHPLSRGALDLRSQASILDLYDADRQRQGPVAISPAAPADAAAGTDLRRSVAEAAAVASIGWQELDQAIGKALQESRSVALLSGPIDGPANADLLAEFAAGAGGGFEHVVYHPYAADATRAARAQAFGEAEAKDPVYHLDRARVVVTLGSCLLAGGQTGLDVQRGYGDFKRVRRAGTPAASQGQLIAFEATLSQTGAVADLRHRVAMADLEAVAWALAKEVKRQLGSGPALPDGLPEMGADAVPAHPALQHAADGGKALTPIAYAAQQLVAAKGAGLVYVGGASHTGPNSHGLHLAANYLNALLGNEGVTVETASAPPTAVPASIAATRDLMRRCRAGEVDTLIIWGCNPVYSLPESAAAIATVADQGKAVVVLDDRLTETAQVATHLAPTTHDLESWGDAEARHGVYSLQQPLTKPLWDVRQPQESLMAFAVAAGWEAAGFQQDAAEVAVVRSLCGRQPLWQAAANGIVPWHRRLQRVWQETVAVAVGSAAAATAFWQAALADGVAIAPAPPASPPQWQLAQLPASPSAPPPAGGFSLVLSASRTLGDGSQANNAWLQEVPDPLSKITWDNYLAIGLSDAKRLGEEVGQPSLDKNQMLRLQAGAISVDLPVVIQPGVKAGHVELFLGWGRSHAGLVADDALDPRQDGLGQRVNAFALQDGDGSRWGLPVSLEVLDRKYVLAETQHHNYQDGRPLAASDPLELHQIDPQGHGAKHHHLLWNEGTGAINRTPTHADPLGATGPGSRLSLWDSTHVYPGRRWSMTIDLSTCTGCSACIVACQAENNVPAVGRDEVRVGREMHWLRLDRYYATPAKKDAAYEHATVDVWNRKDQHSIENSEAATFDPEHLEVVQQPMLCQQCGHAPCEEVCPAMATMHSHEGINLMVYNRCIGTRFCANNCPYKVRRFNFYEYSKLRIGPRGSAKPLERSVRNIVTHGSTTSQAPLGDPGAELGPWQVPLSLVLNPEVTVRSKGVMEKCNFCLQRTRDIRDEEKHSGRPYDEEKPGNTTACAQTCPSQAIVFGDANDPHSLVNEQLQANPQHYLALDQVINVRPAIAYLRQVRNRPLDASEREVFKAVKKGHDEHGDEPHHHDEEDHGDHGEHHDAQSRLGPATQEGAV